MLQYQEINQGIFDRVEFLKIISLMDSFFKFHIIEIFQSTL
ncbi:hypothetical protein LX95_01851 [Mesonia algae]|uniref:Uncharacterized protein n=1 Tax=Mesonia algae TaxID=213248 RepID=A0A2W7IQ43_9FLAO|nr:hypothetical protein LX95_01851 [Mesonia algae]